MTQIKIVTIYLYIYSYNLYLSHWRLLRHKICVKVQSPYFCLISCLCDKSVCPSFLMQYIFIYFCTLSLSPVSSSASPMHCCMSDMSHLGSDFMCMLSERLLILQLWDKIFSILRFGLNYNWHFKSNNKVLRLWGFCVILMGLCGRSWSIWL